MKFVADKKTLLSMIIPAASAASNKTTLPALEGLLFTLKDDTLTVCGYDLEKGVRITIEAKVIEEGCYIINAQKFNQTLRVMEGEEVTLTVDEKLTACGTIFASRCA